MKMTVRERQARIHRRVRKKINGTAERPRLNVFRSNKGVYVQIIDDTRGHTLVAASSKEVSVKGTKTETSAAVGKLLAEKAKEAGITKAVFDRGGYLYHGRVKAVAEGAREGGLAI
ncbi:MAG: 50S ribosomal protein L18 [Saprospiraceae bacterium]|nr:50S ribosomal protein L18 [Saprospiraceae bacterium]